MKPTILLSLLLTTFVIAAKADAQTSQLTENLNQGTRSSFSLTLTQTHGVSSNVTMTPDYLVTTKANLVVGAGSSTVQQTLKGTAASLINDESTRTRGLDAEGVSGNQTINYGTGTEYGVTITPRIKNEEDDSWKSTVLSQASGQALGISTSTLTVDSTNNSFINSFTNSIVR
jgi:hypothetical protein